MPRRDFLTSLQQAALVAVPEDEGELIRRYSFTAYDTALVQQRRGDANRLGFAVQLCHLRFPGQILGPGESPDPRLTNFVALQLIIAAGGDYIKDHRNVIFLGKTGTGKTQMATTLGVEACQQGISTYLFRAFNSVVSLRKQMEGK